MINNYVVTYIVCSVLSLVMGLVAAVNGLYAARRWESAGPTEDQYHLEKRVYLIMTLVSLGLCLRLFMVPLWFGTLHSLLGSIPGAMCLMGVHNSNTPYSYLASGLKLLLPPFYGFWLILNSLDRKVASQPFLNQKLLLLTPLGILILGETLLDTYFFFTVPYRQVSCCTSLFDMPRANVTHFVTQSRAWLSIFYTLIIFIWAEVLYFFFAQKGSIRSARGWWFGNKAVMFGETVLIIATFGVFIHVLNVSLSPLFLHRPWHQCIFCLGQEAWDALLFFGAIFLGLTFFLIYFWVVSFARYREFDLTLTDQMTKLLAWSGAMLTGGIIILSVHLFLVLFL